MDVRSELADQPLAPGAPTHAHAAESPAWNSVFSLLRAAGEARLLFDGAGIIAVTSGALTHLVGTDPGVAQGRRAAELPTHWGPAVSALAHQAFVERAPVANDLSVVHPTGQTTRVGVRATPMLENGTVLGVGITLKDAAASRIIDTAARGDLASAIAAAAFSPFATLFLDARGNCIATGGPLTRVSGLDPETAKGQGWMGIIGASSVETFRQAALAAQHSGEGWRIDFEHASGTGILSCAAGVVLNPNRQAVGYVVFLVDADMLTSTPTTTTGSGFAPPAADEGVAAKPSGPVQPVERYRLPTAEGASSWSPPKIVEGYTDPSRLSTERPVEAEAEPVIAELEPGTDKVTGLPNRVLFAQHVAATIERIRTDALTVAVSVVDLRGVRRQRETLGRRPANDSLFLLAKRLESSIRSIEIAGVIDQDMFAVLSINWLFAEDLPIVARRLLGRLEEPLAGRDGEFVVDMRLGMSVARPGDNVDALFARAGSALLSANDLPERYFIDGL